MKVGWVSGTFQFSATPVDGWRRQKFYNFRDPVEDPEIPVLIVFVVRHIADRKGVKTPQVLLMLRSEYVGSLPLQYSPIAGVDDRIGEGDEPAILGCLEEISQEAGISADEASSPIFIGRNMVPSLDIPGRIWDQGIWVLRADVMELTTNWENLGGAWVSLEEFGNILKGEPRTKLGEHIVRTGFAADLVVSGRKLLDFLVTDKGQELLAPK